MGCVYLPHRGTSIYWMKYKGVDGKIYRESTGKDREEAAKTELRKREGNIANDIPVTPADGRLTCDDALAAVVADYRVNGQRSLNSVHGRIKHLTPVFGRLRMTALTAAHFRAYAAKRQAEGAANATINRELALVKRAFNLAIEDERLHHCPTVPMLAEDNVRTGYFERAQYEDVRSHLPAPLQPVIDFAYITGWRIAEVLTLKWSQVIRQTKTIRLEPGTTKNKKPRNIGYGQNADLVTLIEDQWTEHVALQKKGIICPWVFQRETYNRKTKTRVIDRIKDFRGAWDAATEAAGCPGRWVHDFRRSAGRNLIRAGVSQLTAREITGHKTGSMFDRYDIQNEADTAEALGKLDRTWTSGGRNGQKGVEGGRA